MKGSSIILVKGISGSGKSTRIYMLLDFITRLGGKFLPYYYTNKEGKKLQVGVYSEDFDIVFIGKFYNKGKVHKWQGLDSMTSKLVDSDGLSEFITHVSESGSGLLLEGSGTTASWRLRPMELCCTNGILNILHVRYDYADDQFEEYIRRVKFRSGKAPNGDSMWRKHKTFASDFNKAVNEASEINTLGGNAHVLNKPFDAPVWDLGVEIFKFYGLEDIVEEFKVFCENSNYQLMNSYANSK